MRIICNSAVATTYLYNSDLFARHPNAYGAVNLRVKHLKFLVFTTSAISSALGPLG